MLIVREESSTLTTGTTEWFWSPTSPRVGWFSIGSRWTIICKSLKQLFKSNLKGELVSWEQNIQIHTFIQISGLWGEDTCKKKVNLKVFLSKLFQMRDQVGFQDVPTRLQSCFGGAPSVDAHSEQIFISFIIDHHHYVILHLKFICSHSQLLERNLSFFFIRLRWRSFLYCMDITLFKYNKKWDIFC